MNKTLKVATVFTSAYGRNRLVRGENIRPGNLDPNHVMLGGARRRNGMSHKSVPLEQAKLNSVELEFPLSYGTLDALQSVYKRAVEGSYSLLTPEKANLVALAGKEYNVPYDELYEFTEFLEKAAELSRQPMTTVLYWE